MSLTYWGWVLAAFAVVALPLGFLLRSRAATRERLDVETCKAGLGDIGLRLKRGELDDREADAARLTLLLNLRRSRGAFAANLQSMPRILFAAAAILLIVSGLGAAVSPFGPTPGTMQSGNQTSYAGPDGELLSGLANYVGSVASGQPAAETAAGEMLPDVNVMIERLAARLETSPQDIEGWRTLGWSYVQTGRHDQAVKTFARALELNPDSAELKQSYEEVLARSSGSGETHTSQPPQPLGESGKGPDAETAAMIQAMPADERDATIRAMVDGLAQRLESSPRDVEGWIRLMRSRVVLGEMEVAASSFRKALEIFADDPAASGRIAASAAELGLKTE